MFKLIEIENGLRTLYVTKVTTLDQLQTFTKDFSKKVKDLNLFAAERLSVEWTEGVGWKTFDVKLADEDDELHYIYLLSFVWQEGHPGAEYGYSLMLLDLPIQDEYRDAQKQIYKCLSEFIKHIKVQEK